MSQSLANIVVHLVFSTKDRRPLIRDEERSQMHAYIAGILKNHDSPLIEINSVRDPFQGGGGNVKSCIPGLALSRFTPGYHIAGFQP